MADLSDEDIAFIKELREARENGIINRRQALGLLAGIGIGGAASYSGVQTAAADASTSDSDGNVGTPDDRVDVFGDGVDAKSVNHTVYIDPGTSDVGQAVNDAISNNDAETKIVIPEPDGTEYTLSTKMEIDAGYYVTSGFESHPRIGAGNDPIYPEIEVASGGPSPAVEVKGDAAFTGFYVSSRGQGIRSWGAPKIRAVVDKVESWGIKHSDQTSGGSDTNSNIARIEASCRGNGDFDSTGVLVISEDADANNANGAEVICHDMIELRKGVRLNDIGSAYLRIQHHDIAGQSFTAGDSKVIEFDNSDKNVVASVYSDEADIGIDEINGSDANKIIEANLGGVTTPYSAPATAGSVRLTQDGDVQVADKTALRGATKSSVSPGFGSWQQPDADRSVLVLVEARAETDGTSKGSVILEVDDSGGTSADDTFTVSSQAPTTAGDNNEGSAAALVPAGGQYQINNNSDPNNGNTLFDVREVTL